MELAPALSPACSRSFILALLLTSLGVCPFYPQQRLTWSLMKLETAEFLLFWWKILECLQLRWRYSEILPWFRSVPPEIAKLTRGPNWGCPVPYPLTSQIFFHHWWYFLAAEMSKSLPSRRLSYPLGLNKDLYRVLTLQLWLLSYISLRWNFSAWASHCRTSW